MKQHFTDERTGIRYLDTANSALSVFLTATPIPALSQSATVGLSVSLWQATTVGADLSITQRCIPTITDKALDRRSCRRHWKP